MSDQTGVKYKFIMLVPVSIVVQGNHLRSEKSF